MFNYWNRRQCLIICISTTEISSLANLHPANRPGCRLISVHRDKIKVQIVLNSQRECLANIYIPSSNFSMYSQSHVVSLVNSLWTFVLTHAKKRENCGGRNRLPYWPTFVKRFTHHKLISATSPWFHERMYVPNRFNKNNQTAIVNAHTQ